MKSLILPISALLLVLPASADPVRTESGVRRIGEAEHCEFGRILPDPAFRRVAIWRQPQDIRGPIPITRPDSAYIADLDSGDAPALTLVRAAGRVDPLRWTASGDRLLVRIHTGETALVDPAAPALHPADDLAPIWRDMRIEPLSHGSPGFATEAGTLALLRRIEADGGVVRGVASVGPAGTSFLIHRPGNGFRFTAYAGEARWDTGVSMAYASAPLLPGGARTPLYMGAQRDGLPFLAYARPLLDRGTGRVAGRFGWERIEFDDGRTIDLGAAFGEVMAIRDAAARGDAAIALVELEREMRIVRADPLGIRSWPLCRKKGMDIGWGLVMFPPQDALPPQTATRSEVRFTDGRDGPFGFLYRPRNTNGQLIVMLHGGPTVGFVETPIPAMIGYFLPRGTAVLTVEYSGMLGGGMALSERLTRRGVQALREDMNAVTRWVRASSFANAYLVADSFGGVPAVLAATEHPDAYRHFFLRVPMLGMRDPDRSVRRNEPLQKTVLPSSQREFEEAVYGGTRGRARFGKDLRSLVARLRPSPRMSFYFGTLDPVSSADDLPAAFHGHRSVMILGGTHQRASSRAEVLCDMIAKMEPLGGFENRNCSAPPNMGVRRLP